MAAKAKSQPKVEETKIMRPNELAKQLDVDPKRLRAFLRQEFARSPDAKNTNWELSQEMIDKATEKFASSDDKDNESASA